MNPADLPSPLITLRDHWEAIGRPDPLDALWLLGRYTVRVLVFTGKYRDAHEANEAACKGWWSSVPKLMQLIEALNSLAATEYAPEQALMALIAGASVATDEPPIDPVGDTDGALKEVAFCDTLLEGLDRRDSHINN